MVITRTYRIVDSCDNEILVTQTITVDDQHITTSRRPAAVTVECVADVPAPDAALITDEADNCGVGVVEFVGDVAVALSDGDYSYVPRS